jgi:hypothetical protein
MSAEDFAQEWDYIKSEILNRPQIDGIYPSDVALKRELLFILRAELINLQTAFENSNADYDFHNEIYNKVKRKYQSMK